MILPELRGPLGGGITSLVRWQNYCSLTERSMQLYNLFVVGQSGTGALPRTQGGKWRPRYVSCPYPRALMSLPELRLPRQGKA
jgi:hypothetical protein